MTSPRRALDAGRRHDDAVACRLPPLRHHSFDLGGLVHLCRYHVDGKVGRGGSQQRENVFVGDAVGVYEDADMGDARRHLLEHAEQFGAEARLHHREAGQVAARMREARH
jgi:hypothetical protein